MNYQENAVVLNEYLRWLKSVMEKRLREYFDKQADPKSTAAIPQGQPSLGLLSGVPDISYPQVPLANFIYEHNLDIQQQLLLLIALAPHINPGFYNDIIRANAPGDGDFPFLGTVKGEQFRGLMPTGETAHFILGGIDLAERLIIQEHFREDRFFAQYQVLRLESPAEGDPLISGKISISQEYVDLFLTGTHTKPRFGPDFPAQQITTPLDWQDLVLSQETLEQVNELRRWLRYKNDLLKVNKRLKPGYRALFYGPPGTGKTLTACLLGKKSNPADTEEEEYDVYRIDLSLVVSKFIGETEKNLSKLFDKAEHKNWILFFDEADSLFGKRTSVRDAHDKYANQEISYLLQRIENYNGLIILASNFRTNIDSAFSRRFQSMIHFAMPNQTERLRLWQGIMTEDLLRENNILDSISSKYEISGASILNVAQTCFLKKMKSNGVIERIEIGEIENAIVKEFNKEGKILK